MVTQCYEFGQKSVILSVNIYKIIRSILFCLPAESAHRWSLLLLKMVQKIGLLAFFIKPIKHPVQEFGLTFYNPVGIAAGFDKNADYIDLLFALGFGFVEVGTVTPKPQPGNPKPRMFRLKRVAALINRLGFNNKGVDYLVAQLKKRRSQGIVGVNIGKNKVTPIESAVDDYIYCLQQVYSVADYIVINISSPNTKSLRDLQHHTYLDGFIGAIMHCHQQLKVRYQIHKPILVKLSPDASEFNLDETLSICKRYSVDGIIATNTSTDRACVHSQPFADEVGGLSGAPILEKSNAMVQAIANSKEIDVPIIGVGGVSDYASAKSKLVAGASLLQLYTGFIYQGPRCIKEAVRAYQDIQG